MHLVVYSPLPIDQIEEHVDALFSLVPVTQARATLSPLPILPPSIQGKLILIDPIKETRDFHILWEIPSFFSEQKEHKTAHIVGHLLDSQHPNSLSAILQEKGYVKELHAYVVKSFGNGTEVLSLSLDLTKKGVEQLDAMTSLLFSHSSGSRTHPIP